MKTLVLTRGLPASSKSTFIENNGLEPYTLSADKIRLLYRGLEMDEDGHLGISIGKDKETWDFISQALRERMSRGEFIIVDATHLNSDRFEFYKQLKDEFRYRVYLLDFSDVDADEAIRRNMLREPHKRVKEYVIRKFALQMSKQTIPGWMTVIKPEEFKDIMVYEPLDFSNWKRIHHIGDLHGCYTALKEYLDGRLKEDELYIFTGDLLERGIENADILEFLLKIYTKKNVIFVEGNHEKYLFQYAKDEQIQGRAFRKYVAKELDERGIAKKDIRKFCRKMRNVVYYKYGNKVVLVTHGGLTNKADNLLYISSEQLIRGVGGYDTDVDKIFTSNVLKYEKDNNSLVEFYQIHGHRNEFDKPVDNGRSFNLEGKVERGGHLRAVTLDEEGFHTHEIENKVYDEKFKSVILNNNLPIKDFIQILRNNTYINERDNGNGISSFNFNKKVFFNAIWNKQTMKARGLHIDVINNEIVGRSFDKFYNIGEIDFTTMESLEENIKFPLTAHLKENGYLGILGLHKARNEFYFSSKAASDGKYAEMFKKQFINDAKNLDRLKEYMKINDVTLVFEVIKVEEDPHMIEYKKDKVVLLAIVKNNIEFEKLPYNKVKEVADLINIEVAAVEKIFTNWNDFKKWYDEQLSEDKRIPNGKNVEGFVLEDAEGFHVKIKNPFYSYWKFLRNSLELIRVGHDGTSKLEGDDFALDFVEWSKDRLIAKEEVNIIELRNEYLKEKGYI